MYDKDEQIKLYHFFILWLICTLSAWGCEADVLNSYVRIWVRDLSGTFDRTPSPVPTESSELEDEER